MKPLLHVKYINSNSSTFQLINSNICHSM